MGKLEATPEDVKLAAEIVKGCNNEKSEPIRRLAAEGWTQGRISRTLSVVFYPKGEKIVRPQHVSNVLRAQR
jgi:hypothetical protein